LSRDGNIRYFEYENGKFELLSEYKSADPQRGVAFLPKRGVNMHENEVMRAFKTVNDSYIEPISFLVPRRAEVFQDDIFPPTLGSKPAMSAGEWFGGKEGLPPKIDLASVYAGEEPAEIAADYKPTARAPSPKAPSPVKKAPEPEPEATPSASALRGAPHSMNQQTASIKDLASKFTDDKEDDESGEESSDFEEIAKPIDRSEGHATPAAPFEKSEPKAISRGLGDSLATVNKPDDFEKASQVAASQDTKTQIRTQQTPSSKSTAEELPSPSSPPPASKSTEQVMSKSTVQQMSKSTEQPIQNSLAEIKSLLEIQTKTLSAQSQEISKLTAEVDRLRSKLGE
jgi:coronin-1B/1C/6